MAGTARAVHSVAPKRRKLAATAKNWKGPCSRGLYLYGWPVEGVPGELGVHALVVVHRPVAEGEEAGQHEGDQQAPQQDRLPVGQPEVPAPGEPGPEVRGVARRAPRPPRGRRPDRCGASPGPARRRLPGGAGPAGGAAAAGGRPRRPAAPAGGVPAGPGAAAAAGGGAAAGGASCHTTSPSSTSSGATSTSSPSATAAPSPGA